MITINEFLVKKHQNMSYQDLIFLRRQSVYNNGKWSIEIEEIEPEESKWIDIFEQNTELYYEVINALRDIDAYDEFVEKYFHGRHKFIEYKFVDMNGSAKTAKIIKEKFDKDRSLFIDVEKNMEGVILR